MRVYVELKMKMYLFQHSTRTIITREKKPRQTRICTLRSNVTDVFTLQKKTKIAPSWAIDRVWLHGLCKAVELCMWFFILFHVKCTLYTVHVYSFACSFSSSFFHIYFFFLIPRVISFNVHLIANSTLQQMHNYDFKL